MIRSVRVGERRGSEFQQRATRKEIPAWDEQGDVACVGKSDNNNGLREQNRKKIVARKQKGDTSQVMVAHTFNNSIWEAEAGRSL